jgi:ADP-heptose:LPS heptosyltransferase
MKNVVMRFWSTRIPDLQYSCPGFGDIVHSCLLTYLYGQAHGEPATLHIASHQYNRDKPTTWNEVIKLFPKDTICLKPHKTTTQTDQEFLNLVLAEAPNAELHYYKKYPGKLQQVLEPSFFVDEYIKTYPCLSAVDHSIDLPLPEKFVTAQFDAGSEKRKLSKDQLESIFNKFKKQGYEIVTVGGEASDPLLQTATYAGYAMSRAQYHIGVDSGYMHLAQMYFKPENIYLYTNRSEGKWEHHLKMFRDCECKINAY